MKILWAKCDFLHPTDKGGRIRTLEMLRRLHLNHEIIRLYLMAMKVAVVITNVESKNRLDFMCRKGCKPHAAIKRI